MHVITGLKYLFSIVNVRLAVSAFYAMQPRWHPWNKALFIVFGLIAVLTAADVLEHATLHISILTFIGAGTQMLKVRRFFLISR